MCWGFRHMQKKDGGSVYLRLSSHPLVQPERAVSGALGDDIIAGAYWLAKPGPKATGAIIYSGALAAEAREAHRRLTESGPSIGLMAVTSADRLYQDWREKGAKSHLAKLLSRLEKGARLVTVLDGHPATLGWIGSALGNPVRSLGVDRFGQCGDVHELYRAYGIDAAAIEAAFGGF